jgi:hypothetical protein
VLLHAADLPGRTLTVDVIQFLTGQAARDAYQADHPDDPDGPPNDYYLLNVNPRLRTLPVAADVEVELVLLHLGEGADLKPSSWERLLDDLAGAPSDQDLISYSPFWLTLDDGVVTRIEEQYRAVVDRHRRRVHWSRWSDSAEARSGLPCSART